MTSSRVFGFVCCVAVCAALLGAPVTRAQSLLLASNSPGIPSVERAPQFSVVTAATRYAYGASLAASLKSALAKPGSLALPPRAQSVLMASNFPMSSSTHLIGHMESSFQSLDTPFVSQVRLPIATIWHGRLRFDCFESNLPTDYILWGLPGAGTIHGLSWTGGGHAAVLVPTDEDSYGLHVTFHIRQAETGSSDSSGWRGFHRVLRLGRDLFHR